jgi:uncharacterized repeat protein (TIGR01451 family)
MSTPNIFENEDREGECTPDPTEFRIFNFNHRSNPKWRIKMRRNKVPEFKIKKHMVFRRMGASTTALMVFAAQVTPALATIDNTGTATGTYGGTNYTSASTVNVPVATAAAALTVVKSAGVPTINAVGSDLTIVDANDTITYTYTVKNTGNVTLSNVLPTDQGPKFNGIVGTNTLGAISPAGPITLLPGASQIFTAVYTLSTLDVDRAAAIPAGVSNTASATGKTPTNVTVTPLLTSTATTTIAAGPKLQMTKSFAIADVIGGTAGKADLGEIVTYTFTVTNTGNVPMSNVSVADVHEGVTIPAGSVANESLFSDGPLAPGTTSTDAALNNGTWTTLQPGAVVKFTWTHAVTQAEVDGG